MKKIFLLLFLVLSTISLFGAVEVLEVLPISGCGKSDGSITIIAEGTAGPFDIVITGPNGYTFNYTDLQGKLTIDGLSDSGVYDIEVHLGVSHCFLSLSTFLPCILSPETIPTALIKQTCKGSNVGSIVIGEGAYSNAASFSWSGPNGFTSNEKNISNLSVGEYQLTLEDVCGSGSCKGEFIYVVTENKLDVSVVSTQPTCTGQQNGSVSITLSDYELFSTPYDLCNILVHYNVEIDGIVHSFHPEFPYNWNGLGAGEHCIRVTGPYYEEDPYFFTTCELPSGFSICTVEKCFTIEESEVEAEVQVLSQICDGITIEGVTIKSKGDLDIAVFGVAKNSNMIGLRTYGTKGFESVSDIEWSNDILYFGGEFSGEEEVRTIGAYEVYDIVPQLSKTRKAYMSFVEYNLLGISAPSIGLKKKRDGLSLDETISIVPNPFTDGFTLEVISDVKDRYQISIFDVFGKELLNEKLEVSEGLNQFPIHLDVLSGNYFIRVIDLKGTIRTKRLVKC